MRANQIMTPQVITVGAETTIIEAIHLMLQHHIGGLPVLDATGALIGIVSQGDFIRRAEIGTQHKRGRWLSFLAGPDRRATDFAREHGRKVADIMTPNPLTVTEDTPLDEVVQIMETHNIKRVPVMHGNRLVGMLTRKDFLPAVANLAHNAAGPSADDDHIRSEVMAALPIQRHRQRRNRNPQWRGQKEECAQGRDRRGGKCRGGAESARLSVGSAHSPARGGGFWRGRLRLGRGATLDRG
jgi:CBS domain-containing protein